MFRTITLPLLALSALIACGGRAHGGAEFRDSFPEGNLNQWRVREGSWHVREGRTVAEGGFATLIARQDPARDVEVVADVAYAHDEAHAAAGIMVRVGEDATGYAVGLREIEKGVHPEFGPWERPVLQLFRMDRDGWKLLQESKVMGGRSGRLRRLKVVCRGPNLWVFDEDMATPTLTEFDDRYDRAGSVGLWKDHTGVGLYDNVSIHEPSSTPPPPLRTDWSAVRGAVYVRSDAVNAVQMWHDYWPHTDVVDRELSYAADYGFNMVQVYLHWIVWDRHKDEYLRRIDDFLTRAAAHGLKVNLILWDDCGHVEPALTFADPVPGRQQLADDDEPGASDHGQRGRATRPRGPIPGVRRGGHSPVQG